MVKDACVVVVRTVGTALRFLDEFRLLNVLLYVSLAVQRPKSKYCVISHYV